MDKFNEKYLKIIDFMIKFYKILPFILLPNFIILFNEIFMVNKLLRKLL